MKTVILALVALCAFPLPNQAQVQGTTATAQGTVQVPMIPELRMDYPQLPATGTVPYSVDPSAPAMQTSWTTSDGFSHSVITPKRVGEGKNNQAKRHHEAVTALANEVGYPAPVTLGGGQ